MKKHSTWQLPLKRAWRGRCEAGGNSIDVDDTEGDATGFRSKFRPPPMMTGESSLETGDKAFWSGLVCETRASGEAAGFRRRLLLLLLLLLVPMNTGESSFRVDGKFDDDAADVEEVDETGQFDELDEEETESMGGRRTGSLGVGVTSVSSREMTGFVGHPAAVGYVDCRSTVGVRGGVTPTTGGELEGMEARGGRGFAKLAGEEWPDCGGGGEMQSKFHEINGKVFHFMKGNDP